jgi:hypothetical protein
MSNSTLRSLSVFTIVALFFSASGCSKKNLPPKVSQKRISELNNKLNKLQNECNIITSKLSAIKPEKNALEQESIKEYCEAKDKFKKYADKVELLFDEMHKKNMISYQDKINKMSSSKKKDFENSLKKLKVKNLQGLIDKEKENFHNYVYSGTVKCKYKIPELEGIVSYQSYYGLLRVILNKKASQKIKSLYRNMLHKKVACDLVKKYNSKILKFINSSIEIVKSGDLKKTYAKNLKYCSVTSFIPRLTDSLINEICDIKQSNISYFYDSDKIINNKYNGFIPRSYKIALKQLKTIEEISYRYSNIVLDLKAAQIANSKNPLEKIKNFTMAQRVYQAKPESALRNYESLNVKDNHYFYLYAVSFQPLGKGKSIIRSEYFDVIIAKAGNSQMQNFIYTRNTRYSIVAKYAGIETYQALAGTVQAVKLEVVWIKKL